MKFTMRALLVLVLVLGCSQLGCSFLFVKRVPSEDAVFTTDPVCSYRATAPVADTVLGASWLLAAAVAGVVVASGGDATYQAGDSKSDGSATPILVGTLAFAGLHLASGIWGFGATRECREYRRAQRAALAWAPTAAAAELNGDAPQP